MNKRMVHELERKALAMQQRLAELQAVHSSAALHHSILVGLCDTLSLVRDTQQQLHDDEDQEASRPILASLPDSSEWPLLAQLCALEYGLVPDPSLQPSSTPGSLPTMAPANNCLAVLQQVVAQPSHPRAAVMTSDELQQSYSASIRDSAMLLNLLHRPASTQQHLLEPPLQQLNRLWMRHIHLVVSLALLQRGDLMFKCVAKPAAAAAGGGWLLPCACLAAVCYGA
jgi:hypothetical protein